MKRLLLFLVLAAAARAGTLLVSDFTSFAPTYYSPAFDGPWSSLTAVSGTTAFSVRDVGAGTPSGNIGNAFIQWLGDPPQDWSGYGFVSLTGSAGPANATPYLDFYVEDATGTPTSLTRFALGDFSGTGRWTITVPFLLGAIDPTQVYFWGFVVSEADAPAFDFTFDHLVLSTDAASAVYLPDSVNSGIVAGLAFLGLAAFRRPGRRVG